MTHYLPPDVTAHRLVADTAVQMAEAVYEEVCSRSNAVYKVNADRKEFVRHCAPTLRAAARTVLASMLTDPNTCEWERERIHEALVLDQELPKDGTSVIKANSW